MKKLIRTIIMSSLIIAMFSIQIFAFTPNPPSNVILEGNADGIVFISGEGSFLTGVNMVPGDTIKRTIIIENKYDVEYEIFMRSERDTEEEEEYDLLNKLDLTISYNNQVIYNGSANGEDGLINNISLGTVKPGESKELYAEVNLDGPSTGNEYKNKFAEVKWIFTASNNGKTEPPTKLPQTGDNKIIFYYILILIGVILLLVDKKEAI